jgi:hypothetical protein
MVLGTSAFTSWLKVTSSRAWLTRTPSWSPMPVDEPRLEQRPRHRLERRVHFAVQLDLVVERAEDAGDGALLG